MPYLGATIQLYTKSPCTDVIAYGIEMRMILVRQDLSAAHEKLDLQTVNHTFSQLHPEHATNYVLASNRAARATF